MQAFKERTNKECFSLISAELYFDSCRHDTMLTFKEGRRGHVASLLLSPLLTRNFKNTYLSTDFVTRCCNVTVLMKPVETANMSNINSKIPMTWWRWTGCLVYMMGWKVMKATCRCGLAKFRSRAVLAASDVSCLNKGGSACPVEL